MHCPRCQHENPSSQKYCGECGTPLRRSNESGSHADLERALSEALEQQTATSEILRVISSSPTSVEAVFDTILASALRLCDTPTGGIFTFDGRAFHIAAAAHWSDEFLAALREAVILPGPETPLRRVGLNLEMSHVADIFSDPSFSPPETYRLEGMRTSLAVPMLKEGRLVGALTFHRREVRPFTEAQIALIKIFADQAVIAIENVRLFKELETRNADLTEALEQQTATAEILRAISSSPTDLQPVLDTVVRSAARFCGAYDACIFRLDGDHLRLDAHHGPVAQPDGFLLPVVKGTVGGRTVLERRAIHVADLPAETAEFPEAAANARRLGFRTILSVPLVREGVTIGAIQLRRPESAPFTDKQVSLLQTFSDQAVIAIENVRLFKELEARNGELTTALDRQTATADVLRIIAQSPTELQPVLDSIATSAVRLCAASDAVIERLEGDHFYNAAHAGAQMKGLMGLPLPLTRRFPGGRAILDRKRVIIDDIQLVAESEYPDTLELLKLNTVHSCAEIPLLSEGKPLGNLAVLRAEVRPFTDAEIALLETFADQAVIAIENVRLFTELQEKNRALTEAHGQVTEALDQQTATSEILRTIAHAQTDVQPVFDTIVRSAAQLCHAAVAAVFLTDGRMVYHPANYGGSPAALAATRARYPRRLDMETMPGMAILTRSVVNLPDIEDPSVTEHVRQVGTVLGFRSALAVPMLREGEAVGAITAHRREPGRFSDAEVELLKTFADQAVIAIENVRLFKELEARTGELTQSVEQLTALSEVSRAVSSTLDVETVLDTIVSRASQLASAAGCSIYEYDAAAEQFQLRATHNYDAEFVEAIRAAPLRKGEGLMGRAAEMREPIQIPDITQPEAYQSSVRDTLIRFGYRALLAVPLLREDQIIGSLSFNRKAPGEFSPEVVDVLKTFATQSALAIQNARLFREIADKSAQLEAASRHKSEFLANMSHELRTPLNAIIGFSEVLAQGMFGAINEKQTEYLQDILESGRHLLSLINDILDLSKIEAGRMELEPADFDLPSAIENALILVRERASRHGIKLGSSIDKRLGMIGGDERKVKQVLLNLLSNALKFTPEGGQIDVAARLHDDRAEVSVADTGIGIAPTDQDTVFEEFRQVGTADKKAEGTGLGLTLSRKFIELHGGKIWVQSAVGRGSTFTFTLPVRPWPAS